MQIYIHLTAALPVVDEKERDFTLPLRCSLYSLIKLPYYDVVVC